jgi:hypothetical protein
MNVYTLLNFRKFKKQSIAHIASLNHEPDELNTLRTNFSAGIINSAISIGDLSVKDSLGYEIPISSFLEKTKNHLLVCRFSELNCESCVSFSIKSLLSVADSIGKDNILFLGSYHNNRIFNKQKSLFGIDSMYVANILNLNIPAENLGFPYYFILDSALTISNLSLPDKGSPEINYQYLKLVKERFFKDKN